MLAEALPAVSIVIPSWNAARFVDRVLEALWSQDYPHFEVIIIDNGVSNDETSLVVKRWQVLFQQRSCILNIYSYAQLLGYAGAVNEGVRRAEYDWVAINNNDNLPARNWLRELIQVALLKTWKDKPIAAVSANVVRPGVLALAGATNLWGRVVLFPGTSIRGDCLPNLHPDGSSFLFSRNLVGAPYLNEYFIYHEDVYLGLKIWNMGLASVMAPKARVDSFDGGSTRRLPYKTAYFSERNRIFNWLCFWDTSVLLRLGPLFIADLLVSFLFGSRKLARIHAWSSVIFQWKFVLRERTRLRAERMISNRELITYVSAAYFAPLGFKKVFNQICYFYCRLLGIRAAANIPFGES